MKNSFTKTKKIGAMSMFVAIGLVLQYIESRLSISDIPGGKLGLANMVSIVNIFVFGGANALLISSLRSVLGCVIMGTISAVPYSFLGAFFSVLAMWGTKKWFYPKVSMIGISVIGAVIHNLSQLFIASIVFSSQYVFSYLPGFLILSVVSGTVTGYTAGVFSRRAFKEVLK